MIDKEVIDKERMYAENQLKEKSGSNIVVEWMSAIKEIAENGYALSSANVHSKDEKCSYYGIKGELIYGICKSNSMDFNCCSSNNRYENYRISMVLVGVFITIVNELKGVKKLK